MRSHASFGELFAAWFFHSETISRRIGATLAAFVVILLPSVLGPAAASILDESALEDGAIPVYAPKLSDEGLDRKGLVVVHAPNYVSASQLPQTRKARGLVAPNFLWLLHEGSEPPEVRRLDDQTLELRAANGWSVSFFRSSTQSPFRVGETVKTLDFVATVKEVDDGKATVVEFRFRAPLEHPSFAWVTWAGDEFEPFSPRDRWPADVPRAVGAS